MAFSYRHLISSCVTSHNHVNHFAMINHTFENSFLISKCLSNEYQWKCWKNDWKEEKNKIGEQTFRSNWVALYSDKIQIWNRMNICWSIDCENEIVLYLFSRVKTNSCLKIAYVLSCLSLYWSNVEVLHKEEFLMSLQISAACFSRPHDDGMSSLKI